MARGSRQVGAHYVHTCCWALPFAAEETQKRQKKVIQDPCCQEARQNRQVQHRDQGADQVWAKPSQQENHQEPDHEKAPEEHGVWC